MMMHQIQEWIHRLELGSGARVLRTGLAVLAFLVLAGFYDWREYRNFATEEAMDQAQVARNIAAGRGFSTGFIRPLSVALLEGKPGLSTAGGEAARLKGPHPDLANAPLYPLVLAGMMKVLRFDYHIPEGVIFLVFKPEVCMALLNQLFLFLSVLLTFLIARRLFDSGVAWLAAAVFAATDLFWRFSVSGLSSMLLQVWMLVLVWLLVRVEESARDSGSSFLREWFLAMACGGVTAAGALTRYSFGWLIIPVILFFLLCCSRRRWVLSASVLGVFVVGMAPWLMRNVSLCGRPFGIAGFAITQETTPFPGDTLIRSLDTDVSGVLLQDYVRKGLVGVTGLLNEPTQWTGGNWFGFLFLAGLFLPFIHSGRSRLRAFVLGAGVVLAAAQVLGKTHLSAPGTVHSENLLVLLTPLVLVFSAALYRMLSEQLGLLPHLHRWLTGVVVVLASLPLIMTFLPPRSFPLAYPPYAPPVIQRCSTWMGPDELMMSDIPWAVAWYGDRQCIWTTLSVSDRGHVQDFYAVNDTRKAVKGLYLTQRTLEGRLLSDAVRAGDGSWGYFAASCIFLRKVPTGFPLAHAPGGFLDLGHFFLADYPRWSGQKK